MAHSFQPPPDGADVYIIFLSELGEGLFSLDVLLFELFVVKSLSAHKLPTARLAFIALFVSFSTFLYRQFTATVKANFYSFCFKCPKDT